MWEKLWTFFRFSSSSEEKRSPFWRKSRVCFSLVTPGVFPHACRCAGADTRSCIAHSASLKYLPSPFTFTDNGLIYSWFWVKFERFLVLHRWRKLRWSLHMQSVVHQLIILHGWRGEGKKRKTPDARVYACALREGVREWRAASRFNWLWDGGESIPFCFIVDN